MAYLSSKEFLEPYAAAGAAKAQTSAGVLLTISVLACALIALGCAATNTAAHGMENVGLARMVRGLLAVQFPSTSNWSNRQGWTPAP